MKRILFLCAAIGLAAGCTPTEKYDPGMKAPVAKKINKKHTIHGDTRIDPYYWMNQRKNPEVIAYLQAENAYTREQLANTEDLQQQLYDEITGRIQKQMNRYPFFLTAIGITRALWKKESTRSTAAKRGPWKLRRRSCST